MLNKELHTNWKRFSEMLGDLPEAKDKQLNTLSKRYVEQNIAILNDIIALSIDNLKKLHNANTVNEIICTQAHFTTKINEKLVQSTQGFLNASLGNIADYNEWLKANCDLSTD
ncbi:MAG: hypothetical protein A3E84_00660 [Gammaproteobacteria bacterium RIFCSPHIGHO2_12_FULL_42_13]|nr:MAG: hypothetical protein A3E84_00660 [Gammaproteobacteria bacterium RIFCSPHIGHO2_12_FULL_42_13]